MAIEYAPLFALETQFQTKDGRNNTGGWLKVFLAATDDPAVTYSDYNYTRNPEKIILDDDGRALVICDKSKAYRLEVYDMNGMLLWTEEPVFCSGTGGGGVSITRVISTDGSIAVSESTAGSTTTYDIGMAPSDSVEFLEWGAAMSGNMHEGGIKPATLNAGTMEMGTRGPRLLKDHYYHITNWMTVIPSGTGRNYETLTVTLHATDGTGWHSILVRDFDIDTSVSDSVTHEFSLDFLATEDCEIFWELSDNVPNVGVVDYLGMNVHRIYSGINAVPGTCATKQWVQETFDYGMSGKIGYSALGYNGDGDITGISGSSIAGGLDSAAVSSIASSVASSYAESAASSKQDISGMSAWIPWTGSSVFQPSGDYAFSSSLSSLVHNSSYSSFSAQVTGDISGLSSTVSGISGDLSSKADRSALGDKFDKSASGMLQPSGDYAYNSAVSSKVDQSAFDDCCSSVRSALDDKLDKSASGQFAPSADYAYNSSLSAYYPASASGAFQPSGNYQTAGDYAFNSSVSSKLDASASGDFVLNSAFSSWSSDVDSSLGGLSSSITSIESSIANIENNITSMSSDMSAYVPFSGLEGDGVKITGISGSAIKGHEYTGISPVNVDNVNGTISVEHRTLCVDSTLTAYNSGSSAVLGVNVSALDISSKLDASASSMFQLSGDYAYNSALSSKMDASASSDFYSTGNPSGFITGVDLSEYAFQSAVDLKADASVLSSYQPTSAMSAYATESWASAEISAKLDVTASSLFITALPADLATTADVASAVSGKMDKVDGSAFYPMTGNPSGFLTAHQSLAGLATEEYVDSAVSGKLDSTAYDSAQFQLTADMTAYQPSGDYYSASNPSGFITGVDLSPYQTTADMTAYQPAGDYQPSGDYIYASALGIAEV